MAGDITINYTNSQNIVSDKWVQKVARLVPKQAILYQMAPFREIKEYVSGKCFIPVYGQLPQGHTLLAPGSNQDTNPSNSPDFPKAEVPIPAISYTQAITTEQILRMQRDPVYSYKEIIPNMAMLRESHVGMIESLNLYGMDTNGFGDIAAIAGNQVTFTAQNYAKGLFMDRGNAFFDIWRAGVWTGQKCRVIGPMNNVINTILVDPADVGKLAVGDILRPACDGQYTTREYRGIISILNEGTSLFGISMSSYPLFRGSVIDNANAPLKFENLLAAMIKSGFYSDYGDEEDGVALLSPLSFGDIVKEVESVRTFGGDQYNTKAFNRGTVEGVKVYGPGGVFTLICHPKLKAQHCVGLKLSTWMCPGIVDVNFIKFGLANGEIGYAYWVPQSLRFEYKTYSQRAIFCHDPAKNFLIYNINPSATFDVAA